MLRLYHTIFHNRISDLMDILFASNAVDCGFKSWSGQTKDFQVCCLSPKHTILTSKSKDWLAPNHDNVSKWSDMSTRGLLFQ